MARDDNEINGGDVYYFPGNVKKLSHYAIKNKCLNYGFNVITINSDGAKLFSDPTDNKKFEKINTTGKEISTILADLYEAKNLSIKPLAITGSVCIGRGVTISSPRMMLSHAILPPTYSNVSSLYQSGGRLTNNYKQDPSFKKPVIYCTNRVRTSVCLSEERATSLAVKAHRFNIEKVGLDEWKNSHKKWHIESREFDSMEKVYAFIDTTVGVRKRKNLNIYNIDGFYVNLQAAKKLAKGVSSEDRMLKERLDKLPSTHLFAETSNYIVFPVYDDAESVDCKFIVRFKVV